MKLQTAIVQFPKVRMVVALVSADFIGPAGAEIVGRLGRHFPGLPVMLVSPRPAPARAYATFQTAEFLSLLRLQELDFNEVDLDQPPPQGDLPF